MTGDLSIPLLIRTQAERVLAACDGHVRTAASKLDINYTTLYRWLKQWKCEDRAREREAKWEANGGQHE